MSEVNNLLGATSAEEEKKKFGRSGMGLILEGLKSVFLQIKNAVKSVNGNEADGDGNIQVDVVPFAQNLESEASQRNYGTFVQRMAGGDASINDDEAWLLGIKGTSRHDGYVAEVLNMTLTVVDRAEPITATISRDDFIAAFPDSGTLTLAYSSGWTEDPALYGITVTGTPVDGDIITVVYVAEERGEIVVCNPTSFVATGWNLYNNSEGYAFLIKYTEGYRVEGTYTALKWSATYDGEQADITVVDGNFDIPDDGYVWVEGGNAEDTVVYATWIDWTESCPDYAGYAESVVDLSSVMASKFPYGLLVAGSAADEINLNLGQTISRVERLAYSEVNRAAAAATGRDYEFDEDYIYLARANPVISSVTINGSFASADHGIEYFVGANVPVIAELLYGNNLKNKLERNVVTVSSMDLTGVQKQQVRNNIGAITNDDVLLSWGSRQVLKEIKNGSTTVAYLYGRINTKAKIAMIWLVGNANTPQSASTMVSVPLPTAFVPTSSYVMPLKDGKYMEVRQDGKVNVVFSGTPYAGGSVMYPLG